MSDARDAFIRENPRYSVSRQLASGCPIELLHVDGAPALVHAIREPLSAASIALLVEMGAPVDVVYREGYENYVTPLTEAVAASRFGHVGIKTVLLLAQHSSDNKVAWADALASECEDVPASIRWQLEQLVGGGRPPPRKRACLNAYSCDAVSDVLDPHEGALYAPPLDQSVEDLIDFFRVTLF